MTAQRDPVSVWFDTGAVELLQRAYDAPRGTWIGTRLADPSPQMRLWLAGEGIDWKGPDNASVPGGRGLNARDRWTRAFIRALFYNHRHLNSEGGRRLVPQRADALEVDVGRRVIPRGIIPSGRAVRIRIRQGGRAAYQAARQLRDRDRIFTDDGHLADRGSVLELRDWQLNRQLCRLTLCYPMWASYR